MKGKIIVIEGTDCSGKETQSLLLEKKLKEAGKKCIRFGFPMYDTPTGRIVGGPYLGNPEILQGFFPEGADYVDPHIACLYYAADRKYNMEKILPYLEDGYYVILDRYTTSNLAHQGSKIHDKDERFLMYQWIDKLEYWLLKLPKPDYTILLNMPYKYNNQLSFNLTKEASKEEKVLQAYIELAGLYNWDVIDCIVDSKEKSIDDIHKEIIELLKNKGIIV